MGQVKRSKGQFSKPVAKAKESAEMVASAMREVSLRYAGLNPEDMGKLLRKSVDENFAQLEATKTEFLQYKGEVEERHVPDNQARLRAVELAYRLTGAEPGKHAQNGSGVAVNINLPDWYGGKKDDPKIVNSH
jgi:hypothetical protein